MPPRARVDAGARLVEDQGSGIGLEQRSRRRAPELATEESSAEPAIGERSITDLGERSDRAGPRRAPHAERDRPGAAVQAQARRR